MKSIVKLIAMVSFILLWCGTLSAQQQSGAYMENSQQEAVMSGKKFFIDKFIVPQNASEEFFSRMGFIRKFLKSLPGYIGEEAYERTDENGNIIVITVAVWENQDALNKAKEAVQAEYKRVGFNPAEMFKRLNISIERGIYNQLSE